MIRKLKDQFYGINDFVMKLFLRIDSYFVGRSGKQILFFLLVFFVLTHLSQYSIKTNEIFRGYR